MTLTLSAERAVLGAILQSDGALGEVVGILAPAEFGDDRHAAIFRAMLELAEAGRPRELTLLVDQLEATGNLDRAGGIAYVASLGDELPDPAAAEHYAELVAQASRRRSLRRIGLELQGAAADPEARVGDVIEDAGEALAKLAAGRGDRGAAEAFDAAGAALEAIRRECDGGAGAGITTGLATIDADLGPMRPGQLIVPAARTGVGKTALVLQWAHHAAVVLRESVVVFSLEMSRRELAMRLLAQEAGVALWRLQRGKLVNPRWDDVGGDWPAVEAAREVLRGSRLLLVDSGCQTVAAIRARCRARQIQCGLDLVFVDYLQLLGSGERHGNRTEEVSAISRALKLMAGELGVPVVAVSQLNREPERRSDGSAVTGLERTRGEPRLSDLRESGSIENDADAVILLHRRLEGLPHEVRAAVAILAKNRHGPTGRYPLIFDPERVCFEPGVQSRAVQGRS